MTSKQQLSRSRRFFPLRYRFILLTTTLLILLLGSLMVLVSVQQRRTIYNQLIKQGMAIANSLAATSTADLLLYNYVALERSANQATDDHAIAAVIFHDKEGRVAGFSNQADVQNTFLQDPFTENALRTPGPLVQTIPADSANNASELLEIALPIYPDGTNERWGTVRVRLSLGEMVRQIRQVQFAILAVGFFAIVLGIIASMLVAARITRPLHTLMLGTQAAARGNLAVDIAVNTGDEVEILGHNFNTMLHEIVAHRHELELRLAHIEKLQRYTSQLLATMSDGLVSITMTGSISTINQAARRLFGVPENAPQELDLQVFSSFPPLRDHLEAAIAEPHDRPPCELSIEKGDKILTLLIGSSVLYNTSGKPAELIFNIHDISELKNLEASMRQNERLAALGTLAAGMAHEIRNPLSAVKTFVQLLPRKIEKPGFLNKFNRTVPRELNRINMLVEDLLDLSRIPKFNFQQLSVKDLVQQVVETMAAEMEEKNIRIFQEFPPNLPRIQADPLQLTKAFQNILRNGVQAMPEGGTFRITASHAGKETANPQATAVDYLLLKFEDTGRGIDPEALKTIFNPFFTTKVSGTGLGLSITHKVIVEHNGTIDVVSKLEHGTCFTIRLPVGLPRL